jgi:hypothetical protein
LKLVVVANPDGGDVFVRLLKLKRKEGKRDAVRHKKRKLKKDTLLFLSQRNNNTIACKWLVVLFTCEASFIRLHPCLTQRAQWIAVGAKTPLFSKVS